MATVSSDGVWVSERSVYGELIDRTPEEGVSRLVSGVAPESLNTSAPTTTAGFEIEINPCACITAAAGPYYSFSVTVNGVVEHASVALFKQESITDVTDVIRSYLVAFPDVKHGVVHIETTYSETTYSLPDAKLFYESVAVVLRGHPDIRIAFVRAIANGGLRECNEWLARELATKCGRK
jgi:hypothetical protein